MNHGIAALLLNADDHPTVGKGSCPLIITKFMLEQSESSESFQKQLQGWKWRTLWTVDAVRWMLEKQKP